MLIQHPLFQKNITDLKLSWITGLANRFLSTGGISYYLRDEGVQTRAHLFNYFALLNAAPFRAAWRIRVYNADGKRYEEKSGTFKGMETVSIELDGLSDSPHGVCLAHITPTDGGRTVRK